MATSTSKGLLIAIGLLATIQLCNLFWSAYHDLQTSPALDDTARMVQGCSMQSGGMSDNGIDYQMTVIKCPVEIQD